MKLSFSDSSFFSSEVVNYLFSSFLEFVTLELYISH